MNEECRYAIVMPGQLFEREGMAAPLEKNASFQRIAEGFNGLTNGCFRRWVTTSSIEEIGSRFTAPTVMVLYGALCAEIARERFGPPVAVAGYSLGFYAAAIFARCLKPREALEWLARVNAHNESAFLPGRYALASVTGLDARTIDGRLRKWKLQSVFIADVNNPMQAVLAGPSPDVAEAGRRFKDIVINFQILPLDIPLHTPYMRDACWEVSSWWSTVPTAAPEITLLSPINGRAIRDGRDFKEEMLRSLTSPTDFVSMARVLALRSLDWILDLSPGGELGRMLRWTSRELKVKPVSALWQEEAQ